MKLDIDDLYAKGLVVKKYFDSHDLFVVKYARKVFFDNLWSTDDRLLDSRGTVIDKDNNIVALPFRKIFNRFENKTDLPLDQEVIAVEKVNGFMGCYTVYKGKWLASTTGSLNSVFTQRVEEMINSLVEGKEEEMKGVSWLFEICHPDDPHIIQEEFGAYLIGARSLTTGNYLEETALDIIAMEIGAKRPKWKVCKFGELVEEVKTTHLEGFVVRDCEAETPLLKIKSPYYLTKKFFMRAGTSKCDMVWNKTRKAMEVLDEEYYPLLDYIRVTYKQEDWLALDEMTRRKIIEDYFQEE